MNDVDLQLLLLKARVAFDDLGPEQQAHMRHEQRINFVTGNLRLSGGDDGTETRVRAAAGSCPCAVCRSNL